MTSPTPTPTPEDILRAAADYMDEHGKCEGTAEDARGRVCAIGALSNAAIRLMPANYDYESTPWDNPYHLASQKLANTLRERSGLSIPGWSDANDETTVVTFLRDLSKEPETP